MVDSRLYAVTVCVLIQRGDRWLLAIRAPDVTYAPNKIGMIGGHVDVTRPLPSVLEATARREVAEEVGIDLSETPLRYLESEFFITDSGERQITVTFTAEAPQAIDPYVNAPDELVQVSWWTVNELEADPRCPAWLPPLIRRASYVPELLMCPELVEGHTCALRRAQRA